MLFSNVRAGYAFFTAIALVFEGTGFAGTPTSYYNTANTSNGPALKASLNTIVTAGAVRVGYDNTFPVLYVTDEDPANTNNVLMIYGRDSRPKADSTSISNGTPFGSWNREHIFPQSFFSFDEPMRSDLHALMPADTDTNTHRSNNPYRIISETPDYSDIFGNKKVNGTGVAAFEPANVDKGRVARATFFMDVRYEGLGGLPDLTVVNSYPGGTGAGEMAFLNTLLDWHRQYPPTAWERARNEKVFNRQKNANPFVDHPEWVSMIFGGTAWSMTNGDTLGISSVPRTAGTITAGTIDIPMLSLDLDLAANQFHIGQIGLSKLGSLLDGEVTDVKLWYDVDRNGVANNVDTLLDTRTFTAGATNFVLSPAFYVASGSGAMGTRLLVTATVPASASNGGTLQLRVNANSILHSATGGIDTDPIFANQDSNTVTVGSAVSGGDTITYGLLNKAPFGGVSGSADIPMLSVSLTNASNEWDLGKIDIARLGTLADGHVAAVNLYLDNDADGALDAGEPQLATTTFAAGVAPLTLNPAYRIASTTRSFLVTASLAFSAPQDSTFGIRLVADGIDSSLSGGADIDPTLSNFDSSLVTITASTGGGSNLIISEVYEGGGNLKYVELHNLGSTSINLANYRLRRYSNGGITPTNIALSGTLLPEDFYVIANNATDFQNIFGIGIHDAVSGNISHNGNDVYDLQLIATTAVVDTFAADLAGASANFNGDVVAFRVRDQLPNNGGWGTPANPAQATGASPSGYWTTVQVLNSPTANSNATAIASPGTSGGASGVEVPVTMSSFSVE